MIRIKRLRKHFMSTPRADPSLAAQLRTVAEERLRTGTAPVTNGWRSGSQSLALLHGLASDPARAAEALKLLHELQVHQVELDLQHEQMEQERREYADSLETYIALFDGAPFAYLTMDFDGKLLEANRIGAQWLGVPRDEWPGSQIERFFAPESRQAMQDALGRLHKGSANVTFTARPAAGGAVQVAAVAIPDKRLVLMALMPIAETPGS
jgi:PAS domain S-box-containing protein